MHTALDPSLALPILGQLLRRRNVAFAYIGEDLRIRLAGPGLSAFMEQPRDPTGGYLPDLFVEFFGAEDALRAVLRGEAPEFCLSPVARDTPDGTRYLSLEVLHVDDLDFAPGLLLVEEITLAGKLEQHLIQERNELRLVRAELARLREESEARYRSVLTAMAEGVIIQSADGAIQTFNAGAERILGPSLDQIMAMSPHWHAIREDGSAFSSETHPAIVTLRTGQPCSNVIMGLPNLDGEVTWISVNTQPLFKPGATRPYAVVSSFRDITDRKRNGEKIRWLARFPDENPYPVLRITKDGIIIYANRASASLLDSWGIQVNQILPDKWRKLVSDVFDSGSSRQAEVEYENRVFSLIVAPVAGTDYVNVYGLDITDRKQTEESLARSRAEFEAMFNSMSDAVIFADTQRRIRLVNPTFTAMFGYEPEQAVGQTTEFLYASKADYEEQGQRRYQVEIEPERQPFEIHYRRKDGSLFPAESLGEQVRDSRSEVIGFLGVHRDITERKQAEEALRESENKFRALLESAPVAVVIVDHDGCIKIVNARAEETFGYNREELLGQSIEVLLPGRFKDVHVKHRQDYLSDPRPRPMGVDLDLFARRKDGTEFPVEVGLSSIETKEGALVMSYLSDITERRQAEESLRLQSAALESAANSILITDRQGRTTWANPAFTRFTGYSLKEIQGKNPRFLKSGVQDEAFYRDLWNTILAGQVWQGELINRRKDGTLYVEEQTITPVCDERGEITHFVGIKQDITARKLAEERQAQLLKEIESANQELKDFAYVVSHDLKAPLRAISSLADWLAQDYTDRLDEDGREMVSLLLARVRRMHDLIEGVLQYSRAGRIREEKVNVDLNELVADVIDSLAPPPHITITVEGDLPTLVGEKTRLGQVFQNLIGNAIKYMDKPAGEIRVGCAEAGDFWRFSVADNGPGIEEKYFEKIFQLFQTLRPRDEFESTGVGLAVVKKAVELYGGKIWVESKVGEGSTFYFTLPK